MEQESQSSNEEEISEFSPDKILANKMADEIMQALGQSEEAAYLVFLKLKLKFGAGKV